MSDTDIDTETRATYEQLVGAVILNLNELEMTLVYGTQLYSDLSLR
jgi:hypothetical protein